MSDSTCEQVFISYAHADVQWRDEFERMLAPARARGLIDVWSDEAIVAGENWFQNIQRALTRARVGLLLVSDHFLQSEFVKREEFAQLIEAAKAGRVSVRWVPVSACLYECTELKDIQACCDPKRPLDKLPEADRKAAIQKICLEIIQDFGVKQPTVSPSRRETLFTQVQECLRGKYILKEEIAAGKFSVIYRAEREHPRRVVAVKTIVASELDDCTRRAFIESVERAFELTSSAFIKILDHFLDGSPEVLVSEFVSGEQLTRLLQRHPEGLPLPAVKSILLDLAKGIEEAHVRGWRRGEMCPSDILVEQSGLARISPTDFGNLLREEALLHGNYVLDVESLAYMTPERYFGREPSLLTDQYSLGLIAVELLGGRCMPKVVRPCDLEGKRELFIELQEGRGKWAKRSRDFAGVVCRMLRIDPQQRWASMAVVRELLHEIEVSESPEERARKIAISSYVRVQARGVAGERELYSRFYHNLFAAAPQFQRYFKAIDMERQYSMLNRAIHALLEFDPQSAASQEKMREIAVRHAQFNLKRQHYETFLQALVDTVKQCGERRRDCLDAWHTTLAHYVDFIFPVEKKLPPLGLTSRLGTAPGAVLSEDKLWAHRPPETSAPGGGGVRQFQPQRE
jgi:serine/threonine protein kinase